MNILGRMGCLFGRHRRSRGQAKLVGEIYRSKCQYCGVAMRQVGRQGWEVDKGQPYDPHAARFFDVD